ALEIINKYFTLAGMPIAGSSYWPGLFGNVDNEVLKDDEGLQTVRNLAHNMVFLMRSIELGKEKYGMPELETGGRTNFIR
ncbi:MAG: flavodoxin family protein, partial [Lachnospiraceae bacterium]|nr:flavodoxin family protein [Lachnospiraceae bacterium]